MIYSISLVGFVWVFFFFISIRLHSQSSRRVQVLASSHKSIVKSFETSDSRCFYCWLCVFVCVCVYVHFSVCEWEYTGWIYLGKAHIYVVNPERMAQV